MEQVETRPRVFVDLPVRVDFPVLISFSCGSYTVREFTLNLSEGGIFVPTEKMCPPGTRGSLKFRTSQFEEPLVLRAEVVRAVEPGEETNGHLCGLGIRFLDVSDANLERLRQIVEGVRNGTVVETIRKSILESNRTLGQELRSRPTDQKMMLALTAHGPEIDALIRDGTPSVLLRLLECPRLTSSHVTTILRMPQLTTRVLSAIKGKGKWLANQENRFLFCTHMNANLAEAMEQLRMLPPERLRRIAGSPQLRSQIKIRAQELTRNKKSPRFGR